MPTYKHIFFIALLTLGIAHAQAQHSDTLGVGYDDMRTATHANPERTKAFSSRQWTTTTLRSHYISMGYTDMLDTYLSPESYCGLELRYTYDREMKMRKPRWTVYDQIEMQLQGGRNRADNANTLGGMLRVRSGALYQWQLLDDRLTLRAGGGADIELGFLYNTRNQNNPAQLRLAINIEPRVQASYRFHIKGKTYYLRYDAMVPLLGVRFSPNYGQSYYEIFTRGNYDHNIVPTTIIATPSLRQQLTVDFYVGPMQMSIGYLGDYQQADINQLKSHSYSHMVVLGFRKLLTVTRSRP